MTNVKDVDETVIPEEPTKEQVELSKEELAAMFAAGLLLLFFRLARSGVSCARPESTTTSSYSGDNIFNVFIFPLLLSTGIVIFTDPRGQLCRLALP